MNVAVPIFRSRVAPSFHRCDRIRVSRCLGGQVVDSEMLDVSGLPDEERLRALEDRFTVALICGGIRRDFQQSLQTRGIDVINNIAGEVDEVIRLWLAGRLTSGHGLLRRDAPGLPQVEVAPTLPAQAAAPPESPEADAGAGPDCLHCVDARCRRGIPCPQLTQAEGRRDVPAMIRQSLEVAGDIATEPERVLCRVAELVYYCLGMQYRRIGVAFCVDLFSEAQVVARVLSRFFEVTAICCRSGAPPFEGETARAGGGELSCNPVQLAREFNDRQTDLNVQIGLCMGCDVVFAELSQAPVTTLFVKDRLLANNPIGAIHSRYALTALDEAPARA